MIGKLTGTLSGSQAGSVIVEVGGVGYCVRVPVSVLLERLPRQVSLYIHTAVREDAIELYGFEREEELIFFKRLCSVSGIGPKTALGVLNVADVESLSRSIAAGDAASLTKVFGIGKKSAERIVLELRDKVTGVTNAGGAADVEVLEALIALGYGASECRDALKAAGQEGTLQGRLGRALRHLGGGPRPSPPGGGKG